jgi:hypothetical protein
MYASLPLSWPVLVELIRPSAFAMPKSVHDPERVAVAVFEFVGRRQSAEHVVDDARHHDGREFGLPLRRGPDHLREIAALDVVHHEERAVARLVADVGHGHDVRVADAGRQPGFVEEHVADLRVLGQVGVQDLDCDSAVEPADATDAGEEHGGHAAARELGEQLIAAEVLPTADRRDVGRGAGRSGSGAGHDRASPARCVEALTARSAT